MNFYRLGVRPTVVFLFATFAIGQYALAQVSTRPYFLNSVRAESAAAPALGLMTGAHFTGPTGLPANAPVAAGSLTSPEQTGLDDYLLRTQQPFLLPELATASEPRHLQHMPDGLL